MVRVCAPGGRYGTGRTTNHPMIRLALSSRGLHRALEGDLRLRCDASRCRWPVVCRVYLCRRRVSQPQRPTRTGRSFCRKCVCRRVCLTPCQRVQSLRGWIKSVISPSVPGTWPYKNHSQSNVYLCLDSGSRSPKTLTGSPIFWPLRLTGMISKCVVVQTSRLFEVVCKRRTSLSS